MEGKYKEWRTVGPLKNDYLKDRTLCKHEKRASHLSGAWKE